MSEDVDVVVLSRSCGCLQLFAVSFVVGALLGLAANLISGSVDGWLRRGPSRNMSAFAVGCDSASSGMSRFSFVPLNSLQACCISVAS